jgi:hypothetical protein
MILLDTLKAKTYLQIFLYSPMERGTLQNSMTARTKKEREDKKQELLLSIYLKLLFRKR